MNVKWLLVTVLSAALLLPGHSFGSRKTAEPILRLDVAGKGTIDIRLASDKAPKATAHVMRLARQGFYDGQRWFRVINSPRPFLIQTGDPQSRDASKIESEAMGTRGSGARIPYEASGIPAVEGTVFLAAKPGDQDSGDSQFFILMGTYKFLEGAHTSFGTVVSGMDVVRKVAKGDVITSAKVIGAEASSPTR